MKAKFKILAIAVFATISLNAQWQQMGIDINGEAANDHSGTSVSLSSDGSIVAIGAYGNSGNGDESGHVRVYEYSEENWQQMGSDIDGEGIEHRSGMSISLSSDGSILAIGAIYNDGNGCAAGHIRIYEFTDGDWLQKGSDIDGESGVINRALL